MSGRTLIIMRGLPGAGKSTAIRKHCPMARPFRSVAGRLSESVPIVSADHYFERLGRFDGRRLGEAHAECRRNARAAMMADAPIVIVDNCNVCLRDFADYLSLAKVHGYRVETIDLYDGGLTDAELSARCVHGVPASTIGRMRAKYEKTI